jgi:hypothetical protein
MSMAIAPGDFIVFKSCIARKIGNGRHIVHTIDVNDDRRDKSRPIEAEDRMQMEDGAIAFLIDFTHFGGIEVNSR